MNSTEIEFEDLISLVFSNAPVPPKSYIINFDAKNLRDLYEILLSFFYQGITIKYGEGLNSLTIDRFAELDKHMNCIGVKSHYIYYETDEFLRDFQNYEECTSVKLEDYRYYFIINGKYYVLYFSLL